MPVRVVIGWFPSELARYIHSMRIFQLSAQMQIIRPASNVMDICILIYLKLLIVDLSEHQGGNIVIEVPCLYFFCMIRTRTSRTRLLVHKALSRVRCML